MNAINVFVFHKLQSNRTFFRFVFQELMKFFLVIVNIMLYRKVVLVVACCLQQGVLEFCITVYSILTQEAISPKMHNLLSLCSTPDIYFLPEDFGS